MDAPLVVDVILTFCAPLKVPAPGLNVGADTVLVVPPLNGSKICENCQTLCETPVQPLPHWSSATSQKAMRLTWLLPSAKFSTVCASPVVNISGAVSCLPTKGVMPMLVLRPLALSWEMVALVASMAFCPMLGLVDEP